MSINRNLLLVLSFGVLFSNCKKHKPKSDVKSISSFEILSVNIHGVISGDSIYLPVSESVSLAGLVPTITYVGASISPAAGATQNFSNPIRYTVTAEDGTTRSYIVVPKVLSHNKAITSFVFKAASNPGLTSDLTGSIKGDTIVVYGNNTIKREALIPTIVYVGAKISPGSDVKQDFSNPVSYTVTAEDGTVRTYTIIFSFDKVVYVGSDDGNLYALDAATGNPLWKYTSGGAIRSSPTLDNGMVYFLSSNAYVYALNASDGSLKWKYREPVDAQGESYASNPTVQSGIVYINVIAYVIALDANSGSPVWQTYTNFYSSANSPTVLNGIVYDPTFNGGGPVVAFSASDGSLARNYPGGIGKGNPVIVNGTVYSVDETTILEAWDAQTGVSKWHLSLTTQTPAGQTVPLGPGSSPTFYNGKLYVGGAAGLLALDPNTGSIQWQVYSGDGDYSSIPVTGGGLVFAADHYGSLRAFDASTGHQNWSITGNSYNYKYDDRNQLTYANGTLYVGGLDGSVNAINASTGQIKWAFPTGGMVLSGACVLDVGGNVFHTTGSGDQQ